MGGATQWGGGGGGGGATQWGGQYSGEGAIQSGRPTQMNPGTYHKH